MNRPIRQSEFYRLGAKKKLAALVGTSPSQLKRLASDLNYSEWYQLKKGKKRLIEEPCPELDELQKRIHIFLRPIETPHWLKSGKRGIRAQDNALAHPANHYFMNVDIEAFFQSTKREFVYRCLQREFQMRDDVASLLADLLTYKGHIPTGTSTSQIIAFWAYRATFERIHKLCVSKDIAMTLWVDDITFSRSTAFPRRWATDIDRILADVDLHLKMKKTKRYAADEFKTVTGSALAANGDLAVMNAKRREILDLVCSRRVEDMTLKEARSLLGKLASQRQNEPDFFASMYRRCKAHVSQLTAK